MYFAYYMTLTLKYKIYLLYNLFEKIPSQSLFKSSPYIKNGILAYFSFKYLYFQKEKNASIRSFDWLSKITYIHDGDVYSYN